MLCQGRLIINGVDCSYNGERPGTRSKQAGQFSLTTRTLSLPLSHAPRWTNPHCPMHKQTDFFSPCCFVVGFFFSFFFWLPLGCVSVCQHSHDWVFIRLSSGSGPCKHSDRCILSIRAAVQFAAFRICTTCT